MIAVLILLPVSFAFAQPSGVTVTFSSQGAAVLSASSGKVIHGVQIIEALVCSAGAARLPGGLVYQTAVRNAVSPIGPNEARLILERTASFSPWNVGVELITDLISASAIIAAARVVKLTDQEEAATVAGAVLLNLAKPRLKEHAPDPSSTLARLIDPEKELAFSGPGCIDGRIVARYRAGSKDPLGPFPVL